MSRSIRNKEKILVQSCYDKNKSTASTIMSEQATKRDIKTMCRDLRLSGSKAIRGVTRYDGPRGKKQIWRHHVRTWGLSEANVLHWRKYLWHCWYFSGPPAVIRRPHSDSAPWELCSPCPHFVRPLKAIPPIFYSNKGSTRCLNRAELHRSISPRLFYYEKF